LPAGDFKDAVAGKRAPTGLGPGTETALLREGGVFQGLIQVRDGSGGAECDVKAPGDAERQNRHSHAERGNDQNNDQ